MENNEAIVNELQDKNENHSTEGQGENNFDYEKSYKALQPEFDRRNEELYNTAIKLVKKDKKELLSLDKKTQSKVVKELWGLSSIEELKVIYGDDVLEDEEWKKQTSKNNDDDLLKEIKLLKYNQAQSELKTIVNDIKKERKLTDEQVEKVLSEVNNLSTSLALADRVDRAIKIVVPNIDINTAWYMSTIETTWNYVQWKDKKEVVKSALESELWSIFGKYKK